MLTIKQIIFYGSYLVFPFLAFLIYKRNAWPKLSKNVKVQTVIFIILSLLFINVRFVEPNIVTVDLTKVDIGLEREDTLRIAVIADTHLGIYTKKGVLEKVINKMNSLKDIDMLFIAGDHTYFPEEAENFEDLNDLLQPLEKSNVPVYAVLGNHDVELPGPPLRDDLILVLEKYGVKFLNNEMVKFKDFDLVGLGSHWAGEDDVSLLDKYSEEDTVIVLTHNPDTIYKYSNDRADLTIVGHTHGGQVKIPGAYKHVLPTAGKHDEGLYREKHGQLFVTSGVGTIGLPFRFLNPPVIDILEIY